jgi:hypothetical protein
MASMPFGLPPWTTAPEISFGAAARKRKWRSMNFAHKSMQIYAAYWIAAVDI